MTNWLERLKNGENILSSYDTKNLPEEDIKKIQGETARLTFDIEETLPVSEQHKQLKTVQQLSNLPEKEQKNFTEQYKESINESKQKGTLNEKEASILSGMIDSQAMLVALMSCGKDKSKNNELGQDKCSDFLGRTLSQNEQRQAGIAATNQVNYFQELAKKRADGESHKSL